MRGKLYIVALFYVAGYLSTGLGILVVSILIYLFLEQLTKNRGLLITSLVLFTLSLHMTPTPQSLTSIQEIKNYQSTVTIKSDQNSHAQSYSYIGELEDGQRVQLFFDQEADSSHVVHGATCDLAAELSPPDPATNPGQFDYHSFLQNQGIIAISYNPALTNCEGNSIFSHLYQYRAILMDGINETFQTDTIAWLNALIFGDRQGLDEEVLGAYQFWNITHLLAISGLHVGLTLGLIYYVLLYGLKLSKERINLILLVFIPLYIVIAGANPPVIRAGLMAALFILLSFFKKRLDTTDVLSFIFLIVLWIDPYLIYQLGFQFSFVVTFSLVLSKSLLAQSNHWLTQSLIISLVSQLAILPIQLTHFHFTNVLSILINLIMVPIYSVLIIPLSLLLLISVWLPQSISFLLERVFLGMQEIIQSIFSIMGQPHFAAWVTGEPPMIAIVLFYITWLVMMRLWELKELGKAALASCVMISILLIAQYSVYFDKNLYLTMLDVGQAEAVVLELPHRKGVLLFDAGEEVSFSEVQSHDNYENIIKPFLWSRGIKHLDGLWISHADYDHIGSASQVIHDFHPELLFRYPLEHSELDSLIVPTLTVEKGDVIEWKDATFTVLAPNVEKVSDDENERSVVVLVEYDDFSILMTGDITNSVEEELINAEKLGEVDILKVAHHGSDTSTSELFLQHVKPTAALISVGHNNPYNHPSPEVYDRLVKHGIAVYRTDENGAITIKFINGQHTADPFIP
ncbi:DNA internalization-related competence protein ComEC/Rec2 [Alkalibacillus almallahensis]|uniref:DNA internalization-related competence protein ComEC/Rec2 n=1 Tax=Alkalibacillus almallahensis TaxID=1379154 RepID=UPI0014235536|nr:DNA internalization-related competence protein ComEC/Rec2 [Alkalibacillus almallahensis]NIK11314.1 competence protein ComEC [Alkalibacillus almallahensis]